MAKAWAINEDTGAPEYAANELRRIAAVHLHPGTTDRFGARQGVRPHSTDVVTVSGTTWTQHDLTAVVYPGLTSASGPYVVEKAAESAGLNPADGSNPRLDGLDLQVLDDDEDLSGDRDVRVVYVPGTPAGTPVAEPVTDNAIRLATILVPAGGSPTPSVATLAVYTVAAGGILPARTTAELPTDGRYEGMYADQADEDALLRWSGTAWDTLAGGHLPRGIMATPVGTASNGTATSGTTETRDSVLGNYVFTALPNRRYRVVLSGRGMNTSIANRKYEFRIRDGGTGTPTSGSTLVATGETNVATASILGRVTVHVEGTFTPSAGVRTLSAFTVRTDGPDGVCTPVASSSGRDCEFYVEDIGAA